MEVSDAMAAIQMEAERQGLDLRHRGDGVWVLKGDGYTSSFTVEDAYDVYDLLSALIHAGLDWAPFKD